jgi:chromosome transmission fidelity protein 18
MDLSGAFDDFDTDFSTSIFSKKSSKSLEKDTNLHKSVCLSNGKAFKLKKKIAKGKHSYTLPINPLNETTNKLDQKRDYYGVDIHSLLHQISIDEDTKLAKSLETSNKPHVKLNGLLSEKYRPQKWTELLGSEKSHRQLMKWLQGWSPAVFKTAIPAQPSSNDPFDRPQRRIFLIHGPPGIGKTTFAHVIAKHAGYDVLEINASNERAGPIVKEKIKSTVATHRVFSEKPVCIIADEIEGASEFGFIKALVDIIQSDTKATQAILRNAKPPKNTRLLMRPIIAICNDVYAPSLRALRPLAEVVSYRRVSANLVAEKLKLVCSNEHIPSDSRFLLKIANDTESDMRSCLNILQFGINSLSGDKSASLKDQEKSWTTVVNRIFQKAKSSHNKTETTSVLQDIDSCGEYDKIINSCFTMYPTMQFNDDLLQKPIRFGDWLYFNELINRGIYVNQHGSLTEYHGYVPLACHHMFSSYSNNTSSYSTGLEYRENLKHNQQLRDEFFTLTSAACKRTFSKSETTVELLPYLLRLLNPFVNSSMSAKSGNSFKKLDPSDRRYANIIALMTDYNLSFQTKILETPDPSIPTGIGGIVYQIFPSIELLSTFGEREQLIAGAGTYSLRHLINNELETLKYTRKSQDNNFTFVKRSKASEREDSVLKRKLDAESTKTKQTQGSSSSSEPKAKKQNIDFFAKFKKPSDKKNKESETKASQPVPVRSTQKRVWVQFNESFSNAVRRDITWQDVFN